MKKYIYSILSVLSIMALSSCEDVWSEHYNNEPVTSGESLWEAIQQDANAAKFVELIKEYHLDDTLFQSNDPHTFFVPSNSAIDQYLTDHTMTKAVLDYHILNFFIQPNNIDGKRKIQTRMLKFAQFENKNGQYLFDDIPVTFSSPLYANGKYFMMDQVATPKPSLYEYIAENAPQLKLFIDMQDSIVLDKELSKPLGFDEEGNTIYDSVITVINLFEEEYFKVSEEFRVKTATLVFPKEDLYQQALTQMALNIGSGYQSYEDIPVDWQQEELIPYLIDQGLFSNMLEPDKFRKDSIQNILGDYVKPKFFVAERTLCSNGYAYNYSSFEIFDSLYMSPLRNEAESFLEVIGKDRFNWKEDVLVTSDETFIPNADHVSIASNDSILKVQFPKGYEGAYSVEFLSRPMFPRRYLFVVRTNMYFGGVYDIYVNDELVKTFDYYDYQRFKKIMPSVITGKRYIAVENFNKFDFWVDNITEYGQARIRFEYKGPSNVQYNGLMLDYIDCVPEGETDHITDNP